LRFVGGLFPAVDTHLHTECIRAMSEIAGLI